MTLGPATIKGEVRSALSSIVLGGGGLITGDARAGTTITAAAGAIQGAKTPNSPSPTLNPPNPSNCAGFSTAAQVGAGTSYNATTGDLTLTGARTLTLAAGTYCFHNVVLSGGSSLNVSGAVSVKLSGTLSTTGSFINNTGRIPGNFTLTSTYSGANGVIINGGSAYLSIYAPKTPVTIGGGAQFYGAVLGKTLTSSGNAGFHYDIQLITVWSSYFPPLV
jgi:hypothetical protein